MTKDTGILSDLMSRPWSPDSKHGFRPAGLFVGKGTNAIKVAVAQSSGAPTRTALLASWKARRGGRATPVLLIALHPGDAALCGVSGEEPPVYPRIDAGQVELLCRVTRAVKDLRLIGNLANRNNYVFEQTDADKIIAALETELRVVKSKFRDGGRMSAPVFEL